MSLVALLIMLVVVGMLIYAVQTFLPVPPMFKNLICFVLVIAGIVWLLYGGGIGRTHFG